MSYPSNLAVCLSIVFLTKRLQVDLRLHKLSCYTMGNKEAPREWHRRDHGYHERTVTRMDSIPESPRKRTPRPSKIQDASRKWCPRCEFYVPRIDFGNDRSSRDGLAPYCRPCMGGMQKTDNYRTAARARNIMRNYGITMEQFDSMLAAQGGVCAICGGEPTGKNWHVDHDHDTNAVRGILCNGCNTALGGMRDNPAILRAAADYLEKHGK